MKTILTILVALGIPAAFWNVYLKEVPDVRYTISTAIPVAFLETSKDAQSNGVYVVQMEIANSGKAEAKKIVIKIPRLIAQYHLTKHVSSEQVEIINNQNGLELTYPSLPPSAGFQLTLKTSSSFISANEVEVFHQGGKAQIVSTGSRSGETSYLPLVSIFFSLLVIFLFYSDLRDSAKYRYLFKRYSLDADSLLQSEKPWYIRQKDWPTVLADLLQRSLTEPLSYGASISDSVPYKLLNVDMPKDITQSTWDGLKSDANGRLLNIAKHKAEIASNSSEILDLLNTKWPSHLSQATKEELTDKLSKIYCESIVDTNSAEELARILTTSQKPPCISGKVWEKQFKENASKKICDALVYKLISNDHVLDVESLPEWRAISTWDQYKLSDLRRLREKVNDSTAKLIRAAEQSDLLEKKEIDLRSREINASARNLEADALIRKVTAQLGVIEKVVNDPTYLNRVEPYDDTFASGNWSLLKQLVEKNN